MKKLRINPRRLRLWRHPPLLATLLLPLSLLIEGFVPGVLPGASWILLALYVVLQCATLLLDGDRRVLAGGAGALILAACGLLLTQWQTAPFGLSIGFLWAALLLAGLRMGGWQAMDEIPSALCVLGIVVYGLLQLAAMIAHAGPVREAADRLMPSLIAGFCLFAVQALLHANRNTLYANAPAGGKAPVNVRRANTLLVLSLAALVGLTAVIPTLAVWLRAFLRALRDGFFLVMEFISNLFRSPEVTGEPSGFESGGFLFPPAEEAGEPGWLDRLLNAAAPYVAVAALLVLSVILLRRLLRLLGPMRERVRQWLRVSSEDYVDEVEDTRETGRETVSGTGRFRLRRRISERGLEPRQRVRLRYRLLMNRHPEWAVGDTARDHLPGTAASVYERARYSDHPVTEAEAAAFLRPEGPAKP